MDVWQIVLDTDVFVTALRSNQGAAHRLLSFIGISQTVQVNLSVPLVLEYEEVAKRQSRSLGLTHQDIDDILDYLCSIARLHEIFFLWRPFLPDPDDDMVLELAVEAGCDAIITYNQRDFSGVDQFGLTLMTPQELLRQIGEVT